jgi:hypothetical protein
VSHIDTIAFSIAVFERLVARASITTFAAYEANLQAEVRQFFSSSAWHRAKGVQLIDLSQRALRIPGELTALKPNDPHLGRAAKLFVVLARDYPVCVRMPIPSEAPSTHRVTVERRAIHPVFEGLSMRTIWRRTFAQMHLASSGFTRMLQFLFTIVTRALKMLSMLSKLILQGARALSGVSIVAVAIPLENAVRASSYHLEVRGAEQTYVASQSLEDADGITVTSGEISKGALRGNTIRPQGQRIANLHISAGNDEVASWKFVAKFYERTPGSMAIALVTAAAALVPIALIALQEMDARISKSTGEDQFDPIGLLQILLAAPFVIAAMSNVAGKRSLWGSFAAARLSMFVTIFFSFATLVLCNLPERLNGVPGAIWLGIVLAMGLNVFIALVSWVMRVAVQSSFYSRQEI